MSKLQVKPGRAYELLSIARKRLRQGVTPPAEATAWAHGLEGGCDLPSATGHPDFKGKFPPRGDFLQEAGLSSDAVVKDEIVNWWDVSMRDPETDKIKTIRNYQHKMVIAKPNMLADIRQVLDELVATAQAGAPSYPPLQYEASSDPHMMVLAAPDLHIGKLALLEETGEAYDLSIARELYIDAVRNLAGRVCATHAIDRILMPIGNDFLTADNLSKTTTRGTPQDHVGSQYETLKHASRAASAAIDLLQPIAPVEVLMVPGNHDEYTIYALGMILEAQYGQCPQVTVINQPLPRHYITYGQVLIGYAHGHREKQRLLPMLMANEAREHWGHTRFREWHLGHYHHTRDVCYLGTVEDEGVIIRILPSLSAVDRWHKAKGYRAQRAAQALVYHPEAGLTTIFRHSVS
ncbi:MAG: hypothetical protein ACFB21_09340 [Opitutales bacterium]